MEKAIDTGRHRQAAPDSSRLAKVIARAGLCSRREAERWIVEGRVSVDGKTIRTPAFNVTDKEKVAVDGQPLVERRGTRVWLYHKPEGLVVTEKDPEGRPTIFQYLEEQGLPRVITIGRLDINTEGLLLLTNDGGLKRTLELPTTGWLRKYRVRAFGEVTQEQLDVLKKGMTVDGIKYGSIDATLERQQGANVWLVLALREGKNREVKNVLGALGLQVNRLIRISFGPFQLGDLPKGGITVVRSKMLRDQLGARLTQESGADFDSPIPDDVLVAPQRAPRKTVEDPNHRIGNSPVRRSPRTVARPRDDLARKERPEETQKPRPSNPRGRGIRMEPQGRMSTKPLKDDKAETPPRRLLFEDGRQAEFSPRPAKRGRPDRNHDERGGPKRGGPARPGLKKSGPRTAGSRSDTSRLKSRPKPTRR